MVTYILPSGRGITAVTAFLLLILISIFVGVVVYYWFQGAIGGTVAHGRARGVLEAKLKVEAIRVEGSSLIVTSPTLLL